MDKEKLHEMHEAIYASVTPIIKKGAAMSVPEADVLNKAICSIEKLKTIELLDEQIDFMKKYEGNGYSFGNGAMRYYDANMRHNYSGHSFRDRMIANLEKMYDEIHSEHEKQMLDSEIRHLEMAI